MSRRLRAVARLVRAVGHGLRGLATVLFEFPRLDVAARRERIRRWSIGLLRALGVGLDVRGEPMQGGGLVVANHVSWLDIMVVHAVLPQARFVSKADVRGWPLISRLVDSAETIYLERERKRDALRVVHAVADVLKEGGTVAFFPEGTTSTGHDAMPFHANLLQPAIATGALVQPVALRFSDRLHAVSLSFEFIGATTLAESLWRTACADGGVARAVFLAPRSAAGADRRSLAAELRADVAAGLATLTGPGAAPTEDA